MDRRLFLRVAGGGVIAAAAGGCSTTLPSEAVAAWQGPSPGETDLRRWALSYAILAPHSHNLQSWVVDLRQPGEILLSCDRQRLLPQTDPHSRQIMLSHGAFVELLDLALRERSHLADVQWFPEGAFGSAGPDHRPVARIRVRAGAGEGSDPLFAQILHRRTNREAYEARMPSADALRAVAAAAAVQPVLPACTGPQDPSLDRHRAIAAAAWRIELLTPRTLLESLRLLRVGPAEIARHRDGISLNTFLVRAYAALGLFDRTAAPPPGDRAVQAQIEDFDHKLQATPAFFWLATEGNDRFTQVLAGRAWARAQLAATAHGLAMQPLSQALQEYPEVAQPYADIHRLLAGGRPGRTVQMWARIGHAPPVPPAPRRGLAAHLRAGT